MIEWIATFWIIILAAVIGGGGLGSLGSYVVGMRIPFISIVMSHAAMLGAVFAYLTGLPTFPCSLALSLFAAFALGQFSGESSRIGSNIHTSILFSLMIGLTFLGMGMSKQDMTPLLGLMWGSILFVQTGDLWIMAGGALGLVIFGILFHDELKAILFSKKLARSSGIRVKLITSIFLILAAAIITSNLEIVGGLLIYSLLTCPAAAAFELGKNLKQILVYSMSFGIISAAGGFWISYQADLPTGSCITLTAVLIYGISHVIRKSKLIR